MMSLTTERPVPTGRGTTEKTKPWSSTLPLRTALFMVAPLGVAIALFVIYPLITLVWDSVTMGDGPGNYGAALSSGAVRRAIGVTLLDSAVVMVLAVVGGTAMAWTLRTTRRGWVKALVWAAVLLPFWMGVVVKNYAFALLLAREGPINSLLLRVGAVQEPLELMYTPTAVVLGMTYTMLPYAFLAVYPSVSMVNLDLLNAARGMGASERRAFGGIVLPLIRPGLIAGCAIVFAMSIGFYVTPVLLGGAQTPFIATVISDDIFRFFDYPRAAATSVILLVIALTTLAVTIRAVGLKAIRGGLG
ncbi:ABC transporter permease [Thermobifida halotolerans]|uniref:ABC transporter permease n=1 Tax=Thermobifida halotolerans TaxID=483545 RepID=A0AA97M531_9ACTN|nr:ABC transporter permease [Thermobifida halotolerans]UOE20582.1 ABC transporter permease [Thermobifida halotolerans]